MNMKYSLSLCIIQRCFWYLVLRTEAAVRDVRWEVGVVNSAESKAICPAAAEVCDVDILHEKEKSV